MLFLLFSAYALSGYVLWVLGNMKKEPPPASPE
jgi:hypothetical protein